MILAALLYSCIAAAGTAAEVSIEAGVKADVEADAGSGLVLTDISVDSRDDGTSVLEIIANRQLEPGTFFHFRATGAPPREVICFRGVQRPFRQLKLQIGDSNVVRIRTGHHPEFTPPELHGVLDLSCDAVGGRRVIADGARLIMELAQAAAVEASSATSSEASGEVAAAGEDDRPEEQEGSDRAPENPLAQSALPPEQAAAPDEEPAVTGAESPAAVGSGVGEGNTGSIPTITAVIAEERDDGSTLLRVEATAPFAPYSVRDLYFAGAPPRHALSFVGARLSGVPERLPGSGSNLQEIEVYSYPYRQPPEVQLVLVLGSVEVQITDISKVESTLVVRLSQ